MEDKTAWEGASSELLLALKNEGGIPLDQTKLKEWPQTPEKLRGRLKRSAATLRRTGIEITFGGRTTDRKRKRLIKLAKKEGDKTVRTDRTVQTLSLSMT